MSSEERIRAARFYKVSYAEFAKDAEDLLKGQDLQAVYDGIQLPQRATSGSAGYDFFAPADIVLKPGETVMIPTGIRVRMREDFVLLMFPRSSLGFKYRMQLNNTVGVIDSDYYHADNEGHIFARITNDSNEGKTMEVKAGKAFMQGIFFRYGITEDDHAEGERTGGLGSTDIRKKQER